MNEAFRKFDLTGKTALVTGGATGLGYEMSKALALSGATVVMAARREEVLKASADALMSIPDVGQVHYQCVDLNDRNSVQALADHANSTFDGIDIFVGNAGLDTAQPVHDILNEDLDAQMRVNLTANIELTRAFLPHMRKKKWGRLIYSSSAGSNLAGADDRVSVYGAAKSGLNSFARYVGAEGGRLGITANSLIIGVFFTEMMKEHLAPLDPDTRAAVLNSFSSVTFAGRLGHVEEIGGVVQLLASDAGSYINGASIAIDGGLSSTLRPSSQPSTGIPT
jgi:NAD(P)-dependent dehydrogenase (short-subunit alcohol dehydrogenase family)